MYIESVTLRNFRSFGEQRTRIDLQPDLTAFIGNNGTGKTAVCQALQRVFGISSEERTVRLDDFHIVPDEEQEVISRSLSIEAVLAFPELMSEESDPAAVPDFFRQMAADEDGTLKCRIVLEATWDADGTLDGAIESRVFAVLTLAQDYTREQLVPLSAAERSRIQMVYVPASRDGARQVTAFLRGRLWRAAQWSDELRTLVSDTASAIGSKFHHERPTRTVEGAFAKRWKSCTMPACMPRRAFNRWNRTLISFCATPNWRLNRTTGTRPGPPGYLVTANGLSFIWR
ncbi:AAA family ATPase [Arthrobacter sp. efr-133-R2A-120]|uniref:ATP-dependent nuclease n=1 Tax=Arthrobacter sp. efr-133-R2A-120 TaxID=3040277 RepID=UPI00254D78C1|nr:AAA family ATPase [Arthrobacter sp. efr-133-R2A-120]